MTVRRCASAAIAEGAAATALAAACAMPDYAFAPVDASADAAPLDAAPPVEEDVADPDAGVDAGCDGGGVRVTHRGVTRCYFFTSVASGCVNACGDAGGVELATFADRAELEAVTAAVEPLRKTARYWIGILPKNGPSNDKAYFSWVTGEPIAFDKWAPNEPTGNGGCVLQDVRSGRDRGSPRLVRQPGERPEARPLRAGRSLTGIPERGKKARPRTILRVRHGGR